MKKTMQVAYTFHLTPEEHRECAEEAMRRGPKLLAQDLYETDFDLEEEQRRDYEKDDGRGKERAMSQRCPRCGDRFRPRPSDEGRILCLNCMKHRK